MEQKRLPVVLDTDTFNEVDDQFAMAYLLAAEDRLSTQAIYAAPFSNQRAATPQEGMEKSYDEILRLLRIMKRQTPAFRGSDAYLPDEQTPVLSDAARDLARRAMAHTPRDPLYVVAIGAITNVASALLLEPAIQDRIVLVWLGGNAYHWDSAREFNMRQDVAAARVVFSRVEKLVHLPCMGVVDHLTLSRPEMEYWLRGKNALCDDLIDAAIGEAESYAAGKPWTRVIWDVAAVACLLDRDGDKLRLKTVDRPMPAYDFTYDFSPTGKRVDYVFDVRRDAIFEDLFKHLYTF